MSPRALVIAAIAVAVLGVAAVWVLRQTATPADDPAPPADQVADAGPTPGAPQGAEPVPPPVAAGDAPPPWATGPIDDTANNAGAPAPDPQAALRAARMADLQQSMDALVGDALGRSAASTVHLRKAIDALEALDDPAVKANIDIAALRHNLDIAERMHVLVRELRTLTAQPRTPERQARIDALQTQMQMLQAQVRTDVRPPGAPPLGAPAATPAPAPPGD